MRRDSLLLADRPVFGPFSGSPNRVPRAPLSNERRRIRPLPAECVASRLVGESQLLAREGFHGDELLVCCNAFEISFHPWSKMNFSVTPAGF